jgi:N-alpha-acetyltransferase 35, NatC auxiliary subunit
MAEQTKEEDFATQIFNRPLLHDFPVQEVWMLLSAARSRLVESDLATDVKKALEIRLEARSELLNLFHACTTADRSALPDLQGLVKIIDAIENSARHGRPTPTTSFTLKIQRRLASSVPPRPMIVIEKERAFPFMRQLLTDTITSFSLLDISTSNNLLVAFEHFMGQTNQPPVYVRALVQSFLGIDEKILGQFTARDFIINDMKALADPDEFLFDQSQMDVGSEDEQIELGSRVDMFISRCGHSFINLFRTICLNRCRSRRTLCHAALEWDQIQAEAEELDAVAQSILGEEPIPFPAGEAPTYSYSLSSWVYHYKLIQLRSILQSGFELSIYAPHELCGMYWYLSFLTSTHLNHLERISFFVSAGESPSTQPPEVRQTLRHLYKQFTRIKAVEAMAKALHRIFRVLQRHGHFAEPKYGYASSALRYELRMRPFLHISIPEPISADLAQVSSSLSGFPDKLLIEQAATLTQTARKAWEEVLKEGWHPVQQVNRKERVAGAGSTETSSSLVEKEWVQDVRNSIKACIGVGILATQLTKSLPTGSSKSADALASMKLNVPSVGNRDRWHKSWPVPKLQS